MSDQNVTTDSLNMNEFEKKKLPSTLNVLTILTIIGCSVFGLLTLFTPKLLAFSKNMIEKTQASGKDMSAKQSADLQKSLEQIELSQANLIPLMVIGLVGIALCLAGALMMRKLKKDGFWIYVAGQVLPVVANGILMGADQFKGIWPVVMIAIQVTFIALYATQRKFLVK